MNSIKESSKNLQISIIDKESYAKLECTTNRFPIGNFTEISFEVLECSFSSYNDESFHKYWSLNNAFIDSSNDSLKSYIIRHLRIYFHTEAMPTFS